MNKLKKNIVFRFTDLEPRKIKWGVCLYRLAGWMDVGLHLRCTSEVVNWQKTKAHAMVNGCELTEPFPFNTYTQPIYSSRNIYFCHNKICSIIALVHTFKKRQGCFSSVSLQHLIKQKILKILLKSLTFTYALSVSISSKTTFFVFSTSLAPIDNWEWVGELPPLTPATGDSAPKLPALLLWWVKGWWWPPRPARCSLVRHIPVTCSAVCYNKMKMKYEGKLSWKSIPFPTS